MLREPAGAPSTAIFATEIERSEHCHRQLSERLGRFLAAAEAARGADPIEVLHFLGAYVSEDMLHEEATMHATAYPAAAEHLREHATFREAFAALVRAYARYGDDARVRERLRHEVLQWLESHVRTADEALCAFVRAKSDASSV
jgi:hemerythrin-like metal-binding protein